jgi:fumarate hydratase, class I
MNAPAQIVPPYRHVPLFPLGKDTTTYRKLTSEGVRLETFNGRDILVVEREALRLLSEAAYVDINHLLRPGHLASLKAIVEDPEASDNDKFVAYDFLKNANIAAGGVLPMCQDTGTAIIMGKKGRLVWTEGDDEAALAEGARDAYLKKNLRYSQLSPVSMFEEKNTKNNMPAQVEIYADGEDAYKFLFVAKGGGSANKSFLFQATPSILTHDRMLAFLKEKVLTLGTAACPPYHLAIVIGGTSAELTMKTVKLASCRYYDELPTSGSEDGHAFRDLAMEREIHKLTQSLGVGAQFGGKYFCHDVRVIRLPRHGASLPIGLGVSCSADRQALGKITRDGVFLEELEHNPAKYRPEYFRHSDSSSPILSTTRWRPSASAPTAPIPRPSRIYSRNSSHSGGARWLPTVLRPTVSTSAVRPTCATPGSPTSSPSNLRAMRRIKSRTRSTASMTGTRISTATAIRALQSNW